MLFNQVSDGWDVNFVNNMSSMFNSDLNQPTDGWNVSIVADIEDVLALLFR